MRNISVALQTHLDGEVTSICSCISVTRNDGVIVRLTNHDKDLIVNGALYLTGGTFETSAFKASSDLSVDNAQLEIGVDGNLIQKVQFDSGLYNRARFEIFSVNWQMPSDGTIILARGWIGDITVRNTAHATLQLRGLTQALQRNFLSYYSPTCRATFGDDKCGVPVTPFTHHRRNHKYKVGDWALLPTGSTPIVVTNNSFEAQGLVGNGSSGISGWTHGPGSFWSVESAIVGRSGPYYLRGGSDAGASAPGTPFSVYTDISTSSAGMAGPSVDLGAFAVSFSAFVTSPSPSLSDEATITLTMLNNVGDVLKVVTGDTIAPEYAIWSEISVTSLVPPSTRSMRLTLQGTKTAGTLQVAFDEVSAKFWTISAASYSGVAHRVVRIPSYVATDRRLPTNYRFVDDGIVSNDSSGISGWVYAPGSFWKVSDFAGPFSAVDGVYFLEGGNNSTGLPAQIYQLTSSSISLSDLSAPLVTNGSYILETQLNVGNIDLASSYRVKLNFFTASNALLSSLDTGYTNVGVTGVWKDVSLSGRIPAGAASVKLEVYARSGAGSKAEVVFDSVKLFVLNTTLSNTNDASRGRSASARPVFSGVAGGFTYDGALIWQAVPLSFGFDVVANATNKRVFIGSAISGGEFSFHGAKIVWISGANAGTESYVRTWTPTTKELRLYAPTQNAISGGDKFIFSQGCNKTITDCAQRFSNAINFRGEPYLPGPQRILELFTPGV
jgi:hypothetical protein